MNIIYGQDFERSRTTNKKTASYFTVVNIPIDELQYCMYSLAVVFRN